MDHAPRQQWIFRWRWLWQRQLRNRFGPKPRAKLQRSRPGTDLWPGRQARLLGEKLLNRENSAASADERGLSRCSFTKAEIDAAQLPAHTLPHGKESFRSGGRQSAGRTQKQEVTGALPNAATRQQPPRH